MSQRFTISITAYDAAAIDVEAVTPELEAGGPTTLLVKDTFVPAAVDAAKQIASAIGAGPYLVELSGVDNSTAFGEASSVTVTVSTLYTVEAPVHVDAPVAPDLVTAPITGQPFDPVVPAGEVEHTDATAS